MNRRARIAAHVALAVLGVGGTVWLVDHVGLDRLSVAIRGSVPWFLAVVALEGLRVVLDALATHLLYVGAAHGDDEPNAPAGVLLRSQLAAYPVVLLFPAGRAAGEAVKATLLGPYVGLGRAAAAAIWSQSLTLACGFAISLPCLAVAAFRWGFTHPLTIAIGVQGLTAIGLSTVIALAARTPQVGQALHRVSSRLGVAAGVAQKSVLALGWPVAPFCAMFANRVLLAAQLVVLTVGLGLGNGWDGLLVLGAHLVGAAAGDLIPGQLGATEGALALAADALAISVESAVAVALLFHASQLAWALFGALATLIGSQMPTTSHSRSQRSPEQSSKSSSAPPGRPH